MKKVLSFQSVARQLSRRTPQCFNNNNNNKVFKQTFVTHSSMSSAQFIGQSSPGHNWFLEEPCKCSYYVVVVVLFCFVFNRNINI